MANSAERSRWFPYLGPVAMVLGAALVIAGIAQTTRSTNAGECPAGTELLAKFNFTGGRYVFEKPAGNEHVVTISNASALGATWHSTIAVSALSIKGGVSSVIVKFEPQRTDGTFTNSVLPKVGHDKNFPDISNVLFCRPPPVTTTTAPPSTTTTLPPGTTSTAPPVTTTTTISPVTTTTEAPATTTTASTTTTVPGEQTVPPTTSTTTTEPAATTSTVPPTIVTEGTTTPSASTTTTRSVTPTEVVTGPGPGNLAFTGSSIALIVVGIGCLLAGLVLTLFARRRRMQTRA